MKIKISGIAASLVLLSTVAVQGQQSARIEEFSPQGIVKNVRQVRSRFSEPMVPLGDPSQSPAPFTISCPEKGTARWADSRNWIYDFDRDLGAGVRCEFRVSEGFKTLAGKAIQGQRVFAFSTGAPSILTSVPYQGSESIEEEQIFILELDGEPNEASVLEHVYFAVANLGEQVSVRIVSGDERERILKTQGQYRHRKEMPPLLLIQAKRRFPYKTKISLVWGKRGRLQKWCDQCPGPGSPFSNTLSFPGHV